ncbi:DUF771 domain-containing protein [Aerococcaceae bacterium DSM 111020]|nr:DUF771 domain-containing protein [Aerococcaceae bacterium DSM 111020]
MQSIDLLNKEFELMELRHQQEMEELKLAIELMGVGDLKWFKQLVNRQNADWIKSEILYPFRNDLEGHLISYPAKKGNLWTFNKRPTAQWIEENFERIDWGSKRT